MATKGNFEGTATLVAPAGGSTTGTLIFDATTRNLILPMTTATSGANYTGLIMGLMRSVPVSATVALAVGQPLAWGTTNSTFTQCATGATGVCHGYAAAPIGTADATGDVYVIPPAAFVRP